MPLIHNSYEYNELRRRLRKSMPEPEVVLWYYLKGRGLRDFKFRRQHSIGRYIVDFYCPKLRLAVEVGGGQHYRDETIKYDNERTAYLNSLNIMVVRFTNSEVMSNARGVVEELGRIIDSRVAFLDHLPRQR